MASQSCFDLYFVLEFYFYSLSVATVFWVLKRSLITEAVTTPSVWELSQMDSDEK